MIDNSIRPPDFYEIAARELPPADIDHHDTDLYIRKTPASDALIKRLEPKTLLSVFRDNVEGVLWYELPFCYIPAWRCKT
jgi:hypothetical protein